MPIPTSIQTFVTTRLAEIDAAIAPLQAERDELRRWMDEETAPVHTAPTNTAPPHTAPLPFPSERVRLPSPPVATLLAAPTPAFGRRRPTSPIGLRGGKRPSRVRANTVDMVEYLFAGNSYRSIARSLNVGTTDGTDVWLTLTEWLIARDVKSKEDAARKARVEAE